MRSTNEELMNNFIEEELLEAIRSMRRSKPQVRIDSLLFFIKNSSILLE